MSVSGLPRQLVEGNPIHIGTVGSGALVRVDCTDAINVEIKSHREGFDDLEWWISNQGSASDVLLNGERLDQPTRLADGDLISVADVDIRYSGGWLREDHSKARGVTVSVWDLSDERDGKVILREVSFSAREGEFVGILGPSGCGKSSVIQRIAGLAPFCGHISINGHSVGEDGLRRVIAYLPQSVENSLHGGLTVREEMNCNRRLFLAANNEDGDIDSACLKTLNLEAEVDNPIGKLSGGQKRRVAIALALQRQPQLLLLDEPTAGLDPATETEVMQYLQRLARQGRTVLCATHVMENLKLFDKVLVLTGGEENGKSVYFGTPVGLLEHFGVASYPDMYIKLRDESKSLERLRSENSSTPDSWPVPDAPHPASFLRTVVGYLSRSWKDFAAAFVRPSTWRDLIRPIRTILLQPSLIAFGIKLACADKFCKTATNGCDGIVTVLFCAALSVFWLGLVGSVQVLVRERIPGRCLERLGGVSILRYGAAKIIAVLGSCCVQSLVFILIFFLCPEMPKGKDPSHLNWSWLAAVTLYLVCVMGGFVGLAVSSWSKKVTTAVAAVPVVAVLALLFSQPVIGFDKDTAKPSAKIAHWMPCHKPQVYLSALEDPKDKSKETAPRDFFLLFGIYTLIFIGAGWCGQWRHERQWDGR